MLIASALHNRCFYPKISNLAIRYVPLVPVHGAKIVFYLLSYERAIPLCMLFRHFVATGSF